MGQEQMDLPACNGPRQIFRSIIFADFENYSRLMDSQISRFLAFLSGVADTLESVRPDDSYVRTVGDGIFAVMHKATEAADFALALSRAVENGSLALRGQDETMRVRIALHSGSVILADDPIAKAPGYYGVEVNRAARLEQVTPPGRIYATTEFVDALKSEAPGRAFGFRPANRRCICVYFGRIALAKGFGVEGVYEVRASSGKTA